MFKSEEVWRKQQHIQWVYGAENPSAAGATHRAADNESRNPSNTRKTQPPTSRKIQGGKFQQHSQVIAVGG